MQGANAPGEHLSFDMSIQKAAFCGSQTEQEAGVCVGQQNTHLNACCQLCVTFCVSMQAASREFLEPALGS